MMTRRGEVCGVSVGLHAREFDLWEFSVGYMSVDHERRGVVKMKRGLEAYPMGTKLPAI